MSKVLPLSCVSVCAGGSLNLQDVFLPSWEHVSATVVSPSLRQYEDLGSQAVKPRGEILGVKANLIEKDRQFTAKLISEINT